jgi:EpsI family protein
MNTRNRAILIAVFLLLTLGVRAYVGKQPVVPQRKQLAEFPKQLGAWTAGADEKLGQDVSDVLKADDYLSRTYFDGRTRPINLFVAYYNVQKAGESMHSPKNCLPGSGWRPVVNDTVELGQDEKGKPIRINRYLIEKGNDRSLVLYWYQANGRIIASEYAGKVYLVWDALRTGRRDGALVRLVLPLTTHDDPKKLLDEGLTFARTAMPGLKSVIPN